MDILAFLIIVVCTPALVLIGVKLYKYKELKKLLKILALLFLALELIRFFYNAKLYPEAIQPASALTFSYLSVLVTLGLLAVFNKSKIGELCKTAFVLTVLSPIVFGLFDNTLYINPVDEHAVTQGLYFIESGLGIAMALLFVIDSKKNFTKIDIILSIVFYIICAGLDFATNCLWIYEEIRFDLMWFLSIIVGLVVIALPILGNYFFVKKQPKIEEEVELEA